MSVAPVYPWTIAPTLNPDNSDKLQPEDQAVVLGLLFELNALVLTRAQNTILPSRCLRAASFDLGIMRPSCIMQAAHRTALHQAQA